MDSLVWRRGSLSCKLCQSNFCMSNSLRTYTTGCDYSALSLSFYYRKCDVRARFARRSTKRVPEFSYGLIMKWLHFVSKPNTSSTTYTPWSKCIIFTVLSFLILDFDVFWFSSKRIKFLLAVLTFTDDWHNTLLCIVFKYSTNKYSRLQLNQAVVTGLFHQQYMYVARLTYSSSIGVSIVHENVWP